MKKRFLTVILVLATVLQGCANINNSTTTAKTDKESSQDNEAIESSLQESGETEHTDENKSPMLLQVDREYDYISNDSEDEGYKVSASMSFEMFKIEDSGFEPLKASLNKEGEAVKAEMASFKESVETDYLQGDAINPDMSYELEYESKVNACRVDETIFSFVRSVVEDYGGAHPNHVRVARNYNTQTGEELGLGDIFSDVDGFKAMLMDELNNHEYRDEFFDEWEITVDNTFNGNDGYKLEFVLTNDGIEIIFNPYELGPYAMGDITLNYDYKLISDYIKPEYVPERKDTFCLDVSADNDGMVYFDADDDGVDEYLTYRTHVNVYEGFEPGTTYEEGCRITIEYGRDESNFSMYDTEAEISLEDAYIIKNTDGKTYLYLETGGYNDWNGLEIIDLSDPDKGPVSLGYNEGGSFYNNIPTSADSLYIQTRTNVCGTFLGNTKATIDSNGQIVSEDGEYIFSFYYEPEPYIVLQDFEAIDITDEEKPITVSSGEKLIPYCTNNEDTITFINEGERYIRVKIDSDSIDSWPKTINGVPEEEIFDGIIYAG